MKEMHATYRVSSHRVSSQLKLGSKCSLGFLLRQG